MSPAVALFAVTLAVVAPPELAPPLSPADLPPPARPAAPDPAPTKTSIHLSVQPGTIGETGDALPKVFAAVAALNSLRFAEVCPDGVVRGYTETCRVAVVVVPCHSGAKFYVMASSFRPGDSDRIPPAILEHMKTAAKVPEGPKQAGTRSPDLEKSLPTLAWDLRSRPVNPVAARHFAPVATLVLDKHGYSAHSPVSSSLITGVVGIKDNGQKMVMVTTSDGAEGISKNLLVLGTCLDADDFTKEVKTLCTSVDKILHE